MHDAGRHRDGVARGRRHRIGGSEKLELPLEHDERVEVARVEMAARAGRAAVAPEREDRELFQICEHVGAGPVPLQDLAHRAIL